MSSLSELVQVDEYVTVLLEVGDDVFRVTGHIIALNDAGCRIDIGDGESYVFPWHHIAYIKSQHSPVMQRLLEVAYPISKYDA